MDAKTTNASPWLRESTRRLANSTTQPSCANTDQERERLELQARRVAGALVLTGVALGLLVHPYWFGLSAFIGVGLIFAGITGKCPMATLLGKLPGNCCCSTEQK